MTLHGWYNDKPSAILAIQRQPGANVISTVDGIKKPLPQLVAGLPSDIKVTIASDRQSAKNTARHILRFCKINNQTFISAMRRKRLASRSRFTL